MSLITEFDPQERPQWVRKRVGKATASRMFDLSAKLKSGKGYQATRAVYLREKVYERITDRAYDHYVSPAMRWGLDNQAEARATYSLITGKSIELTDFVDHPSIPMSGASPDGLVGADGMVEAKCPDSTTHLQTLIDDEIPEKYVPQMLWQMDCCNRDWCDFVSFDPRLPANMQFWKRRLHYDESAIATLREDVATFLVELDQTVRYLLARYPPELAS